MKTINQLLMLPFTLLAYLFGRFNWTSPPWVNSVVRLRQTKPLTFYGVIAAIVLSIAGYQYYLSLPKPITVIAKFREPQITPNNPQASPDTLDIHFDYDTSNLQKDQPHPVGVPSVARIDLVGAAITQGISITPAKPGKWQWNDDRRLQFTPETDWPAGTQYEVEFNPTIFVSEARLSKQSYTFSTPPLNASIDSLQFYQDPQDISIRRVIATIQFSHPIDKQSLEEKLSMSMRPSDASITETPKKYAFSVTYDKNLREAYIQSEPVVLPSRPNYMRVNLDEGLSSILGGEKSAAAIEDKLLIPDIYSFLKIESTDAQIVRNQKNEPEQVLTLEFTDDIEQQELLNKLEIYLLPKRNQAKRNNYWSSPREVTAEILTENNRQNLRMIANEKDYAKIYNFTLDVPEDRFLYIRIAPGLTSVNRFVHASFYDSVARTPEYPKEVDIAGEGSILTYSGQHQLSILSRGVPALKYTIGRMLDGQINHLVSQTQGDITSPSFSSWKFNPENIAEFDHKIVDIASEHPRQANYSSLDLSQILARDNNPFGVFFINVEGWDKKNNRRIYGTEDSRLILITDLGLIVKNNADRTHNIFVQSLKTGKPVKGANVELLGKNGIPLYSRVTDAQGHADFPSTRDFHHEKEPTVYVVKTASDISFIPFDRYSRQINLSRFDIGGVSFNPNGQEPLNAFLFSDRGIYRPGEKVNIGTIVKNFDMSNVQGIPLEMVITGPRNNQVKVSKLSLAELGFFDIHYQTDETSDTGQYRAALHLVRDNRYRGREIGSIDFKVEEFQPDTLKIQSELVGVTDKGWTDQQKMQVKVSLQNLFGLPAQERTITGRLIIQPTDFRFKEFASYQFTDPFSDQPNKALNLDRKLANQKTDADGLAYFDLDLQQFDQGTYNLRFIAEGFEQGGGRSVVAATSTLVSPLSELIGFKADGKLDYISANSQRKIEFIAIDKNLRQVTKDQLTFRLLHIQNISTLVKQYDNTFQYQSVKKETEVSRSALTINESGYWYTLDNTQAGDFAIEIIDEQDRRLARVNYSIVGHGNLAGRLDKNAELQLKLNKTDYLPGEMIEMNIKAPYAGAGLITIETDKVHHFKWFESENQSSIQTIRLPDNLEGTGYINVTFMRDFGSKEIFTSPLSYAVQPFSIDKSKRRVEVQLKVDEIVRPGKPMSIDYSASKNSKMVIFAVDEGILQVANYSTPDPLGHFLKKRALAVDTLQILDLILPEYEMLRMLSASGGGDKARMALAKNLNPFARKTQQPAVFWSGVVNAGTESQQIQFDVPNTFAGSLRVMAVAVAEEAVGAAQKSTLVRGPFVISPNVLTQVAPDDEFEVTVGIANIIQNSGKNAAIELVISTSDHLTLIGETSTRLNIDEGSEGQFTFSVKANQKLGAAEIYFTVRHQDEEAKRTASLSVRPAMPYSTTFAANFTKAGETTLELKRKLYANLASQTISASASPLVLVDGLTAYLDAFPHGCTEQVVSKVFPLVGLMTHPAYSAQLGEDGKVDQYFAQVIKKLRERQLGDGSFSFWPGSQSTAEYPSVYVMHFLVEAQSLGYPVPADMLERGRNYLADYVGHTTTSLASARVRANAIYLLSRMGVVTTNYLVDLEEYLNKHFNKGWHKDLLAVYMAATYQLLQKDKEADQLIAKYDLGTHKKRDFAGNLMDDFHSTLTQDSQYIFLLAKHFENRAKQLSGDQILKLTGLIFNGEYNTISAAYSVLALGAYSKLVLNEGTSDNPSETAIKFYATIKKAEKVLLDSMQTPFTKANYGVATDQLSINAEQPIFYLNVQGGFDQSLPLEPVRQGIEIQRAFLDEQGNAVSSFEQGKELTVRLRVRALDNQVLTNIAIIDLLPGGFEVIRSSISRTAYNWKADYVDIREDRVVIYGDFDSSLRELTYRVKLTSVGQFVVPPSFAESMYDRSIKATAKVDQFTVTRRVE